jgi:hypothetical protein
MYIYLISSLPMLQFGMKPPFSFEMFLGLCEGKITDKDFFILQEVSLSAEGRYEGSALATLEQWRRFDTALRNELVRIRAGRLQREGERYLRRDGYTEPWIARIAMAAHRNPSILQAERLLDEARWRMLDELCLGHYFDIDFLAIYAHKLLILVRWERMRTAESSQLLEEAIKV